MTADCNLQFAVSHEKLMLKVFLIPMDVLQQEIILLTVKDLKIKGYLTGKFAVRLIELPFTLQHDREIVMFRFYFPLFIKLCMWFCYV